MMPPKKIIIIDCRSPADYHIMHIKDALKINDSKIIRRRLASDKISLNELLVKISNESFIDYQETNVVIYDHQSEHTNQLDQDAFAIILLEKFVHKFKSVSFVIGGFVAFHANYENLCTQASKMAVSPCSASSSASSSCTSLSSTPILNEFMYTLPVSSAPSDFTANISCASNRTSISSSSIVTLGSNLPAESSYNLKSCASNDLFGRALADMLNDGTQSMTPAEDVMRDPTRILDFLYLGSQEDALSEITMKTLGITNVLNVSQTCSKADFIDDAHFLRIPVNDGHAARIKPFFDVAFRFIEKCRKSNTKVIIHCLAGISRSPTLAIAYLMKSMNLKSDDAYKFVKERRATISPNFNFLGQLYEYEKEILKTSEPTNENVSSMNDLAEKESDDLHQPAGIAFLKIRQKMQQPQSANSCASAMAPSPLSSELRVGKVNAAPLLFGRPSAEKTDSSQQNSPVSLFSSEQGQFQGRKKFVFEFSNKPFASQPLCLQSPSTALATFELNSPTTASASTVNQQQLSRADMQYRFLPRSLTADVLGSEKKCENEPTNETSMACESTENEQNATKQRFSVQMRRPTSFLTCLPARLSLNVSMPASCVENSEQEQTEKDTSKSRLKRPSSIFNVSTSCADSELSNVFESEQKTNYFKSSHQCNNDSHASFSSDRISPFKSKLNSFYQKSNTSNSACMMPALSFRPCSSGTTPATSTVASTILERTYSNTSGGSTASPCSCCSNMSTNSSSSSQSTQTSCHACSQQQLLITNSPYLQECSKKMKLSPMKLGSRHSLLSIFNPPTLSNICNKEEKDQDQNLENKVVPLSQLDQINMSCINETNLEVLKTSEEAEAPRPNILNNFSNRLNESRSFETIKSLASDACIDKLKLHRRSTNQHSGNISDENASETTASDDETETKTADKLIQAINSRSRQKRRKKSTSLLISTSMLAHSTSGNNRSSSSSSKTGSNSLNGSIETMISVS